MAKGNYLVLGDKTTCGGVIVEGCEDHCLFGKATAREADKVTCGRFPGMFYIVGGIENDSVHGRRMAGTLDSYSSCPCQSRFIATMVDDTYEKTAGAQSEPEQYGQSYKKEPSNKGKRIVLKNQYGDVILDRNDNPVYEMEDNKRPSENEMSDVLYAQKIALEKRLTELKRWNRQDRVIFKKIFGRDDEASRQKILSAVKKEIDLNTSMNYQKFRFADQNVYAYVSNADKDHYITIANKFLTAPMNGRDSKVVTLCHEMSHFDDVLGTTDDGLRTGAIKLSQEGKTEALDTAYNFERYFE